jgi:hypothetical protein
MQPLDGNAIAGALFEHFGTEMTTARGTCTHCGAPALVGELHVYARAPGAVVRCRNCGNIVMVVIHIHGAARVELAGFRFLDPAARGVGAANVDR